MGASGNTPGASGPESVLGPARPTFTRSRKGFDPSEVNPYLDMIERERADLGAALVLTQARVKDLQARLDRYEALEDELTRSVHLAKQTGDAVIADANSRAEEVLAAARGEAEQIVAAGRAQIADEERALDSLRMAVAAEGMMLKEIEQQLATRISRAAAALVEIVDAPGGLGPFSQATSTLLEVAQLLRRQAGAGVAVHVQLETGSDPAVVTVTPIGESDQTPQRPQPPSAYAANASNSSLIATI